MLPTALARRGSLKVAKVSARCFKPDTQEQTLSVMNGYLHNSFQSHIPNLSLLTGFPGSGAQGLCGIHPGFAPQRLIQAPVPAQAHKSLNPTQYILQNFAFGNSGFYHQNSSTYTRGTLNRKKGSVALKGSVSVPSLLAADDSVKENSTSAGSTPHSSREPSPSLQDIDTVYAPIEDTDMMEARGIKRQMDLRHSPQKKRSRGHDGGGGGDYLPTPVHRNLEMDAMTQYIWQYYEARHQSKEVYASKMRLREALYTLMKGVFPYCGVYIVGSSMNGFGSGTSDMDMCLMLCQAEINQKKEAPEILRILLKALRTCSFLHKINLIRAKVPILKFQDRVSNVEVDLNINNAVGIRNTHLLNSYSRLDWRVSPLVLFAKYWAHSQKINDASQGTISSYSLVLMVIHYLQISDGGQPPVLPSLQQMYPNKFSSSADVRLLTLNDKLPPYTSPNTTSLGKLFKGFLCYYATEFNFQDDIISIRLGKKLPRSAVLPGDNPGQWKFICIEEPFDMSNTARSVYDSYIFQRIYRVIRQSHSRLMKTGNLSSIINVPV